MASPSPLRLPPPSDRFYNSNWEPANTKMTKLLVVHYFNKKIMRDPPGYPADHRGQAGQGRFLSQEEKPPHKHGAPVLVGICICI